jgi:hypothetical protein
MAMTKRTYTPTPLALTLALGAASATHDPVDAGSWVYVANAKGQWAIKVDGGPKKQVEVPSSSGMKSNAPKWVRVREIGFEDNENPPGKPGWEIDKGKRVVYSELIPETGGPGKNSSESRRRLVISEPKGKNPKTLLSGLGSRGDDFALTPDGKAVLCVAERDGVWGLYRVPMTDRSRPG